MAWQIYSRFTFSTKDSPPEELSKVLNWFTEKGFEMKISQRLMISFGDHTLEYAVPTTNELTIAVNIINDSDLATQFKLAF